MEVRINKEVRDYQENLFFGLSLEKFLLAVVRIVITFTREILTLIMSG